MKKKYIILLVVVLMIICIPFLPPIYKRFTRPLYKSNVDAKEWYGKVDCEDLAQVSPSLSTGLQMPTQSHSMPKSKPSEQP